MFSSNSRLLLSLAAFIALMAPVSLPASAQAETQSSTGKTTTSKTAKKTKSTRKSRGAYFVPPPPAYAPSILSYIKRGHGSQHQNQLSNHTSTGHELASEETAEEAPKSTYETHIKTYGSASSNQPIITKRGNNVTYVSHNHG